MRIEKQTFLLAFLILFTHNCVLFLPNGGGEAGFNPFTFLLGLVGGNPASSQNLTPGATIDLSGDGKTDGTFVDSDGDGVSDGINLTGGTTPNLILIDTNGDGIPDAVDSNGDGLPDYYISPNPPGFLTTGPGGTGNPVVVIVDANGNPLGFDTDGDGTPNDTAIVTILGDTTPPTITSSLLTGTFSTTQTTTLTCSDNKAPGSIVYTLDASTPSFSPKHGTIIAKSSKAVSLSTEGSHTLQAICRDLAGNLSAPINIVYTIDTKIPALTIVSQSATAISSSAGAISSSTATWRSDRSGSFTIREGSSCDSGTIATTGSATANVDQGFLRSHTHFTSEGIKIYRICVTASNGLTGFVSVSLQRDDAAPVVTASPGAGSYGEATSVSLSCSDTGGSGCEQVAYAVQAGSAPSIPAIQGTTGTVSSGTLYASAIAMTDGAVTYMKFVARDKAGNVSSVNSQNYTVDTQVATITVNSHTAAINGSSYLSLSWQSSKAGAYQIRLGGSSCANGTALTNTGSNANVSGNVAATTDITSTIANSHFTEGDNTIRICVANLIGSFGSTSRTTNKDSTAPVVTMASPSGSGPFASGTQLQLSCSDTGGSGCDKIIYTLNGTEPTFDGSGAVTNGTVYSSPVALANGSNQVKYLARDVAGNISSGGNQSFDIVGPPDAPAFVEAQAGGTSAVVQWWHVTGATSYTVYYSTSPGVTTASTSFGPVTDPYVTITGLAGGTLYYFRVVASNAAGTSGVSLLEAGALTTAAPPGTSLIGNRIDVSAGQIIYEDYFPSMTIDDVNQKLYVSTLISNDEIRLIRCELNGTDCTFTVLSKVIPNSHFWSMRTRVVVDPINKKVLVVNNLGLQPGLFVCELNLSDCNFQDISVGQGYNSASLNSIKAIIDPINNKLLVIARNSTQNSLGLFRCDLSGINCIYRIITGSVYNSYNSLIIDNKNNKLLVVLPYDGLRYYLFRCNLDGTNCTNRNISTNLGTDSGYYPSISIDYVDSKLLVATADSGNSGKLNFTNCNLDGLSCSHSDISTQTGQGTHSGRTPILNIDYHNRKILIVTKNQANNYKPSLFRCDMDGKNCSHTDLFNFLGNESNVDAVLPASEPAAILDPKNGKLLVLSFSTFGGRKHSLLIW